MEGMRVLFGKQRAVFDESFHGATGHMHCSLKFSSSIVVSKPQHPRLLQHCSVDALHVAAAVQGHVIQVIHLFKRHTTQCKLVVHPAVVDKLKAISMRPVQQEAQEAVMISGIYHPSV